MRKKSLIIALAVALVAVVAAAHEGHHHTAMGVVKAVDEEHISLTTKDDTTETFELTDETTFTRGDVEVSHDDAAVGERAVVVYEEENEANLALEVKLPRKSD